MRVSVQNRMINNGPGTDGHVRTGSTVAEAQERVNGGAKNMNKNYREREAEAAYWGAH